MENNEDSKGIVSKVVETIPVIAEEKSKFTWIDKLIRWGNRVFLGWWICKKKGL